MKCGGMVLGLTFDHRIADAYSFNNFLLAWSEISSGDQISTVPSFRRSLLSPRRPPISDPSVSPPFTPTSLLPPPANSSANISRIYYISSADLHRLQLLAGEHGRNPNPKSKLESFTAFLWKLLGKARGKSKMGVVVDGRRRLGSAMDSYFGNVLSIPYATAEVGGMEVWEIAEIVRGFVRGAASEEHFKGLVDWVEALRPETAVASVYVEEGLSVVVSSGRGFPVGEVEFGWGKAVFGSYHFPWNGNAGYVMPMPSAKGNGDWVVYAYLSPEMVEIVEEDSGGVFRRVSADYLGLK